MYLIYEPRTRVPGTGLCPASEAISELAMEPRSIRAPSADTNSKLSQSSSRIITSIISTDLSILSELASD